MPESFYEEIAFNSPQFDEWIDLYAINNKGYELLSKATTSDQAYSVDAEFLKENSNLVLDTRHFSRDFKDRLLAKISEKNSLEDLINGVLIHGDNYQSLNLISCRYRNQVDCIYIDPPYNTDTSAILYKNNYKHSSWLSFMESRIEISRHLLGENGILISAIDDTEFSPYSLLLDNILPTHNRNTVVINHHPAGAGLESSNISTTHEYAIFMLPNLSTKKILVGDPKTEQYSEIGFIRTGAATSNQRSGRPNSFYAILVNPDNSLVVGAEKPPKIGNQDYPKDRTSEGYLRIYPISPDGTERVWRRSYEKCLIEIEQGNILCSNGRTLKLKKSNANKFRPIFSNWTEKKYNAGVYGTNLLKDLLGKSSFSYPKSIFNVMDCLSASTKVQDEAYILDFFAGSGTTGHAVINLNRLDNKERKYILVEVGHHFNDVILPRIKKAIYSDKWKDGKPVSNNGISHFVKYFDIESYEDTLDGLDYVPTDDDLLADIPSVFENFKLRYALDA